MTAINAISTPFPAFVGNLNAEAPVSQVNRGPSEGLSPTNGVNAPDPVVGPSQVSPSTRLLDISV